MSFYYANARQPEILRTVQKDVTYTDQIGQSLSELLRFSNNKLWIKYNHVCNLIAELAYHGFASWNNLQTLGEEYTGIIQIDNQYITLPNKFLQLTAIVLEFGGERLFLQLMKTVENEIRRNQDLLPEARDKLINCCQFIIHTVPYIQAMHRTWFYFVGGKYQIARRITGINYVLIRYWLNINHSMYGYKVLGVLSAMQLIFAFLANLKEILNKKREDKKAVEKRFKDSSIRKNALSSGTSKTVSGTNRVKCVLCLEERKDACTTICGHLFCWFCILDWLDQKEECPVCREPIKKSTVVYLKNVD